MTIYCGIDPDIDKSGLAVWNSSNQAFKEINDYDFFTMLEVLKQWSWGHKNLKVYVEAGWRHSKSNWHGNKSKGVAARIGKNVGQNHQIGKLLVKFCQLHSIECVEVKPLVKRWGEDGKQKINANEFKNLTGWVETTNPEKRDAALLVWGL